jgi:virulence-associated protein VapD
MYAIAFDRVVADTEQHHPKDAMRMDAKIGVVIRKHT